MNTKNKQSLSLLRKHKLFFLLFITAGLFACQQDAVAADVAVSVRYQDNLLYTGTVALPAPGTAVLLDTNGVSRSVNARSVLAVLSAIDNTASSFALSQLQYFPSFSSLYLKCVAVAQLATEACDNWQYVVNDAAPFVGMDAYTLSGGEIVYVYFGNSRQVVLSNSSLPAGGSLTATAQRYHYQDNTWVTLSGVTLGVKSGNTVIMQSPVDAEGVAHFTLNASPGSYTIGIAEDFYFPSFGLSVYASGGSAPVQVVQQEEKKKEKPKFDAEKAVQFLESSQSADGSFGSPMVSDWAAVALGALAKETEAKERLRDYLIANPNQGALLTDYERRAMALMALGVNPYSGTSVNYIEKIVSSFDGSQFGSSAFINDDAFAILVLLKAGFPAEDYMIQRSLVYLLSHQQADGSFAGSVDMTAAAIQTLSLFPQEGVVKEDFDRAVSFLQDSQKSDGSFGNSFSTSWAMQAIAAAKSPKFSWQKNEKSPMDFLVSLQQDDGSIEDASAESMVWANSSAIPASLSKPWGDILQSFQKPEVSSYAEQFSAKADIIAIQGELDRIREEALAIQREIAVLKNIQRSLAEASSAPALSGMQIFTPEKQEEQGMVEKLGAAVLFAEESIDFAAMGLAIMGLGLALALARGESSSRSLLKVFQMITPAKEKNR